MSSQDKFSLLRKILHALGLSTEAVDDIIDRIMGFLYEKENKGKLEGKFPEEIYPYFVRDDFLSPAEHSFYLVLKTVVADKALICPKVALGDLFYAKSSNPSEYRAFTNKIDRKHIDFLLCDPKTLRPFVVIELDDKSHQRAERQTRDEFVEWVFETAKLPLMRIKARYSYTMVELNSLLSQYIRVDHMPVAIDQEPVIEKDNAPRCPRCGSEMVLRTAKSGPKQGEQFWGCSKFPQCRGILKYAGTGL